MGRDSCGLLPLEQDKIVSNFILLFVGFNLMKPALKVDKFVVYYDTMDICSGSKTIDFFLVIIYLVFI